MVFYEVYVNLPDGAAPDPQGIHYAGNLVFAGLAPSTPHGHPVRRRADHGHELDEAYLSSVRAIELTDMLPQLRARNHWRDEQLTVTFALGALVPPANEPRTSPGVKARIERVAIASDH
jgi:hypothetical protein